MVLAGCGQGVEPTANTLTSGNERIVSIDYCADQMVLGLVERDRIVAVSNDVEADPLFAGRLAGDLPRVRPDAETIIALRPSLVVRSYAGGPRLEATLRRAGVRVFTLPYAGGMEAVRAGVIMSGRVLGAEAAAAQRLARLDSVLAASKPAGVRALYTTPGSYTAGPDTLVGDVIERAGFTNAEQRLGWRRLDIEGLVLSPPQIVIRAFGESRLHQTDRWSSADHSALQSAFAESRVVPIPGSWVACSNWRIGEAVATLRATRR
jgi:iron complex transport system substrate-binding protein